MRDLEREIRDKILAGEDADPCPYGLVHVKDCEIDVAVEALRKNSNYLLSETGARHLAYSVLIALRAAHFDWHSDRALQSGSRS